MTNDHPTLAAVAASAQHAAHQALQDARAVRAAVLAQWDAVIALHAAEERCYEALSRSGDVAEAEQQRVALLSAISSSSDANQIASAVHAEYQASMNDLAPQQHRLAQALEAKE